MEWFVFVFSILLSSHLCPSRVLLPRSRFRSSKEVWSVVVVRGVGVGCGCVEGALVGLYSCVTKKQG